MIEASDIDWLVISLKRTPERLRQFELVNSHVGVSIQALEAVDGLQLDRDVLEQDGLISAGLPWGPGAIGAALSHRLCWLRAIETDRLVVVFEDDVYLRRDFVVSVLTLVESLPADWDVILFGYNTDSILDVEVVPGWNARGEFSPRYPVPADRERFAASSGRVAPLRLHNAFGTCCYAISAQGARKLVDGCFPLSVTPILVPALQSYLLPQTGDALMNGFYRRLGAYVCLPPIAMPINDKQASTVKA